ncbi:MAG: hypothetical protein AABY18_02695 [Candidatus Thermoplasmatota archaeon]
MTGNDEGVSSVVSAVLLVALFTTAMTIWTFTTLPVWIQEREANHQGDAQEAMGQVKAGLDALAAQDAPGPSTTVFDLAPAKVPLLQGAAASGHLAYEDATFAVQVTFTGAVLHLQDGVAVGVPAEPANGAPITDVTGLEAFSLGLQSGSVDNNDLSWVEAVADDGAGATVTARLTHDADASPAGCGGPGIILTVTAATGTRTVPLLCDVDIAVPQYSVDLLAQPAFASALRDLEDGYTLTVTDGAVGATVAGTYAAVWTDVDGLQHAAGAGAATTYSLDRSGGRIVFDPRYQRFPSQTLAYEGGAVLASQGTLGGVVLVDPGFDLEVDATTGTGHLRWTVVDLTGSGQRAGSDTATVSVRHDGSSDLLFEVTGATFTLDSSNAAAWRGFFADRILASSSEDAAASGGSGDAATLTLSAGGATGVSSWLVRLHVVDAEATVN